jgi:membrane protease YdiL (CAAX protease family)
LADDVIFAPMDTQKKARLTPFLEQAGLSQQFLALVSICLISGLLFSLLGVFLGLLLFDFSLVDLPKLMTQTSKPGVMGFLKISQLFSSVGIFIIPPLLLAGFRGKSVFRELGMAIKPSGFWILFCVLLMWVQLPFINALGFFNNELVFPDFLKGVELWMREKEDAAAVMTNAFLDMPTYVNLLEALFVMAVIPALGEELLFRSAIQPLIARWISKPQLAIWLTAFLFSFIHFQFYGFLPRLMMGAFLGYLFYWSGNIWYSVAAHFANNGLAVVMAFLVQHKGLESTSDDLGVGANGTLETVLSVGLAAAGIYLAWKNLPKSNLTPEPVA